MNWLRRVLQLFWMEGCASQWAWGNSRDELNSSRQTYKSSLLQKLLKYGSLFAIVYKQNVRSCPFKSSNTNHLAERTYGSQWRLKKFSTISVRVSLAMQGQEHKLLCHQSMSYRTELEQWSGIWIPRTNCFDRTFEITEGHLSMQRVRSFLSGRPGLPW